MEYGQSIGAATILPIAFSRTIEAHGIAAASFAVQSQQQQSSGSSAMMIMMQWMKEAENQ